MRRQYHSPNPSYQPPAASIIFRPSIASRDIWGMGAPANLRPRNSSSDGGDDKPRRWKPPSPTLSSLVIRRFVVRFHPEVLPISQAKRRRRRPFVFLFLFRTPNSCHDFRPPGWVLFPSSPLTSGVPPSGEACDCEWVVGRCMRRSPIPDPRRQPTTMATTYDGRIEPRRGSGGRPR